MPSTSPPCQTGDYWTASKRPWESLLFLLPFLLVYEIGVVWSLRSGSVRNAADVWLRQALLEAGVRHEWLFPLLLPLLLLGWHLWQRHPWTCRGGTLAGMLGESVLFAMLLLLLGRLLHGLVECRLPAAAAPRAISFLGAGLYEELLFRLLLLPLLFVLLRLLLIPPRWSIAGSALLSSLLFAAAHYTETTAFFSPQALSGAAQRLTAHPEYWYGFSFRMLAGLLFSTMFWLRGFGITAGCHLLYDLTVGVLLDGIGR